ncbi:hypothetical protein HYR99_34105 [Candidatus Poribacteria bacterium]|nr:hypothetical protein [Candidatus Poribacteria bacterium]
MRKKSVLAPVIVVVLLASGNFVSSDGAWQEVRKVGWRTDFREVFFIDTQNGWAIGSRGIILHTSDGGNKWGE